MSSKGVTKKTPEQAIRKVINKVRGRKKSEVAKPKDDGVTELQKKFEIAQQKKLLEKIKEQRETRAYLRDKYKNDEDIRLAEDLRESLINTRFKFFYQPVFDIHTNEPVFHEVFTHMIDQGGRVTEPGRYLPISKGFGLDTRLDEVVFSTLLKRREEVGDLSFSINLTGTTLSRYDSFFEHLMYTIIDSGIPPNSLIFELKFYDIENDGMAAKFIREAIKMQFKFILDYVGGGANVVHMIKKLGFSYIKVDAMEYHDFITDPDAKEHLLEVVNAAKENNIKLIMERVETKEMYDFCKDIGFGYVQGFYPAKPSDNLQFRIKLK
jgi:EAL domain-containing protein (putative c-di-GMP-specific phosphodiesterase class I)